MITQHLESKTVIGLLILLGTVVGLALVGKLTAEAVDAIKWVGSTYMGVRTAANIFEKVTIKSSNDT